MPIALGRFEGEISELRAFLLNAWTEAYRGELFVEFSDDFLKWYLDGPRGAREWSVAARDGGRLVGFIAGLPMTIVSEAGEHLAIEGGFLGVAPHGRARVLVLALVRSLLANVEARGATMTFGFFDGDHHSRPLYDALLGSSSFPVTQLSMLPAPVGLRVLDMQPFLKATKPRFHERIVVRAVSALPLPRPATIRPFESGDVAACLDIIAANDNDIPTPSFRQLWGRDDLAWQLGGSPCVTTLVLASASGAAEGFVNYFRVDVMQHARVPCGVIDFCMTAPSRRNDEPRLLSAAMRWMRREGCAAAVMPIAAGRRHVGLRRCGFVMLPPRLNMCLIGLPGAPAVGVLKSFRVLFR